MEAGEVVEDFLLCHTCVHYCVERARPVKSASSEVLVSAFIKHGAVCYVCYPCYSYCRCQTYFPQILIFLPAGSTATTVLWLTYFLALRLLDTSLHSVRCCSRNIQSMVVR